MVTLENEHLKVSVSNKGAELHSLVKKANGTEYIWQANPDVWGFHAPNLFPVVGGLKDNTLHVNGKSYTLGRHGFARTSMFQRLESTPLQATFSLRYDEETLKVYPYKFDFQLIYRLEEGKLRVTFKVINMDEGDIYFSVGAHPAFNVPLKDGETFEDYYLAFEVDEELITHQSGTDGLFNGETNPIAASEQGVFLTRDLFNHDALVFKDLKSRSVTLKSSKSDKQVKVSFPHMNYLGIWTKANAPFLCIEPWLGLGDSTSDAGKDISEKEGIQMLEYGHVFETDYCIEVK